MLFALAWTARLPVLRPRLARFARHQAAERGESGRSAKIASGAPTRLVSALAISVGGGDSFEKHGAENDAALLFFVARDTASFLGATGGRFGITNETTLGGGLFWELVNVSAGLSLTAYSLPLCGPQRCGQVRGLAPGASVRLDLFGPYLSGALGVAFDCAGTWITGSAAPAWSGVAVRCSAGPLLRFTSHP